LRFPYVANQQTNRIQTNDTLETQDREVLSIHSKKLQQRAVQKTDRRNLHSVNLTKNSLPNRNIVRNLHSRDASTHTQANKLQNSSLEDDPTPCFQMKSEETHDLRANTSNLLDNFEYSPLPRKESPISIPAKYRLSLLPLYLIPKTKPSNFLPTKRLGDNKRIKDISGFITDVSPRSQMSQIYGSPMQLRVKNRLRSLQGHNRYERFNPMELSNERSAVVRSIKIVNLEDQFSDFHIYES